MLPTVTRSSLSSLSACHSHIPIHTTSRLFSSSASRAKIGPESPKFIEIPRTVQPYAHRPREIKGVLPVPRQIFPRRADDKTSTAYLAATTPEPHTERALRETNDPYVQWKRTMSASRRENLREGLMALSIRKAKDDKKVARRSQRKQEDRHRRVYAPPREDERLTAATVFASTTTYNSGRLPDPDREARIAASRQAVVDKAADLRERRADALHSLYMNAREFITNESQLDAKIEEIFSGEPFRGQASEYGENVWDAHGPPPSIAELLSSVNKTQKTMIEATRGPALITNKRMVRLAEELTGGKMDT